MSKKILIEALRRGLLAVGVAALIPSAALAVDTCNGFIDIDYVNAPKVNNIGDAVDVQIAFGTGSIMGGTKLTITSFQHDLDCNSNFPLTPPCTDEGAVIEYEGDSNITTDCPTTWTSNVPGGGSATNQVIFTANPPLDIPAGIPTLPGFCHIRFKVKIIGSSIDNTPNTIQELIGYDVAACDNGVLLSGGFQTADIGTPPPLHFSCYEVPRGGIAPQSVTLVDRFGSTTAKAPNIHRVCAPTDKNGEDPSAPASPIHLTALDITNVVGTFSQPKGLSVVNQFGNYKVDIVAPVMIFVPTSKSLTPPPPPPLAAGVIPHFQCYKLNNVKGPAPTGISVADQFTLPFGGITVDIDQRGPDRLCVPVDKNGEDPGAPSNTAALMCFHTKNDRLPFPQKTVFLTNQFGSFTETFTQYDELCVPAAIM
jgi:hypothetical protein